MTRLTIIPFIAMAAAVLSGAAFAEDRYECMFRCSNEKYDRNVNCPAAQDSSTSNQKRDQCLKTSMGFFDACFKSCPAAPHTMPCDMQAMVRKGD